MGNFGLVYRDVFFVVGNQNNDRFYKVYGW